MKPVGMCACAWSKSRHAACRSRAPPVTDGMVVNAVARVKAVQDGVPSSRPYQPPARLPGV
jgi:hypothetical protein